MPQARINYLTATRPAHLASACREKFLERGTGFEPATITLEE
jgi:hypothetical protein